jgi:hypothetical protein
VNGGFLFSPGEFGAKDEGAVMYGFFISKPGNVL